jgi:SAM-dependent methyltransferase
MTEPDSPWSDRGYLRDVQYRTDANLAARQSIYSCQHPRIDLPGRVLDLVAPAAGETVLDVGCGNGLYLAELARREFAGQMFGVDLSPGMLMAARERLGTVAAPAQRRARTADGAAGSVSLVVADAVALPVRDGAADLVLAMHMLYHVPERELAIRELRRVTRPGGRVVIVLNGPGHLRELREIVNAVRGDDQWGQRERVTLDDGEALARSCFSTVSRHDFVAELRIPGPEPVAEYVRSMSGTQHHADPGLLVASVAARVSQAPGGIFTVATQAGCLICSG